MRLVNLFDARKALDNIMDILEKAPSMNKNEKMSVQGKYATLPYVLNGDVNRIARTKDIIKSFIKQIDLIGGILIHNVNRDKDLYDGEDGWRLTFGQLYNIAKTERTNAVVEFEYDSKCNFGLQCTHVDADGFGSLLPLTIANSLQAGSDGYQKYVFHIECPNGTSDECIRIGINLIRDMYGDLEGIPNPLLITDIPIELSTYNLLKNLGYTWVDKFTEAAMYGFEWCHNELPNGVVSDKCYMDYNYNVNEAMLIDHHVTNPFYHEYKTNGTPLPVGIYVCPTLGELKRLKCVTIPEELQFESSFAYHSSKIPNIDDLKISATYIAEVVLNDTVRRMIEHDIRYMNDDDTAYDRYAERYHSICQAISQWDTFEWRDHPEFNKKSVRPIWIGNMGYNKPILEEMHDLLTDIWEESTDITINYYSRDIIRQGYFDEMSANNRSLLKMADALWYNAAIVTSENLRIDSEKLNCPKIWVVVPFPTIGNASLVAHYIMEKSPYEQLKENGTVGIIMFDPISTTISFRTDETSVCVNKLAKFYYGGGHPQASGCKDPIFAASLKFYLQQIANYRKDTKSHPTMLIINKYIQNISNIMDKSVNHPTMVIVTE